jgi:hypothetical protein
MVLTRASERNLVLGMNAGQVNFDQQRGHAVT